MYIYITMLCYAENDVANLQDNSSGINFLEQNFFQLSAEGQSQLKNYLQSLVSLQNIMTGAVSADSVRVSSNGKRGCS
jgi:hypothetical protein